MKDFSTHAYVAGSSALQPNCSRYSNENERIITFPSFKAEQEFFEIDFTKLYTAQHLSRLEKLKARISSLLQKSGSYYDLRTGDLAGKPLGNFSRRYYVVAGVVYSTIAVCVLYFGV